MGLLSLLWPLLFAAIANAAIDDGGDEERFMVVRAQINNTDQLSMVRDLHDNMHEYDLDFWLTPHAVGHVTDVMVRESRLPWLQDTLSAAGIDYFVSVPDVQKLILEKERKPKIVDDLLGSFRKRFWDEGGNRAKLKFGEYHSYDEINQWMEEIVQRYPDRVLMKTIGTTVEGRPIRTIKLGRDITSTSKRIIWIDAGIHAREWAAVHTALWFIDRLIADYDSDPLVHSAMDRMHFYITPVLNPDGYEYSRSGVSPMIRLWRKNRSNMVCKKDRWFRERCCGGVDLNRNFDWFWGEIGSSSDRCSEIYQGSSAFSEAEARAVRDAMFSPELRGKVDAFLTLHTYSQMWIHPYSHQRKTVPEDIKDIEQVGMKAVSALESVFGTKYRFGTGANILYPSSGGSDDWAKGKGGAKYVYLLELRPGEEVWDGFILDSRQLIPTARETWAGIKVVIDAAMKLHAAPTTRIHRPPIAPLRAPPTTVLPPTTATITHTTTVPTTTLRTRSPSRSRLRMRVRPVVTDGSSSLVSHRLSSSRAGSSWKAPTVSSRVSSTVIHRTSSTHSTSTNVCIDKSPWCNAWLRGNPRICTISSIYMRRDCARTCRYCS